MFVTKIFGKVLLFLVWAGLITANTFCIIQMDSPQFINWVIFSLAAFTGIIFIVDTVLYMILACLMLRK